jgi:hypothetical protein
MSWVDIIHNSRKSYLSRFVNSSIADPNDYKKAYDYLYDLYTNKFVMYPLDEMLKNIDESIIKNISNCDIVMASGTSSGVIEDRICDFIFKEKSEGIAKLSFCHEVNNIGCSMFPSATSLEVINLKKNGKLKKKLNPVEKFWLSIDHPASFLERKKLGLIIWPFPHECSAEYCKGIKGEDHAGESIVSFLFSDVDYLLLIFTNEFDDENKLHAGSDWFRHSYDLAINKICNYQEIYKKIYAHKVNVEGVEITGNVIISILKVVKNNS